MDGRAVLVAGMRGSGKTAWTLQQVQPARRLLVWDSVGEWSGKGRVAPCYNLTALTNQLRAQLADRSHVPDTEAIGYVGPASMRHFEVFCKLAWVWLRLRAGGTLVVEELADVTHPGKAPPAWGEIVRKGRHAAGSRLYALTQRPAESDKSIVGNADLIHCGMMAFPRDRTYMAECLNVRADDIEELGPLDYIERDLRTRKVRRGKVRFG